MDAALYGRRVLGSIGTSKYGPGNGPSTMRFDFTESGHSAACPPWECQSPTAISLANVAFATGRQPRDMDRPARSGAYAASRWDMNSVKSRTRFVLRVSPCVRSQIVAGDFRSMPGTLASR
jgi:hypothetical protein